MRTAVGRVPSMLMLLSLLVVTATAACSPLGSESTPRLRLATTMSINDSGLLDEILPDFEERYNLDVEVKSANALQALALGEQGDVDVLLLHARRQEELFVEQGFGINRQDVMFNDLVIVGPDSDPAGVRTAETAAEAFTRIADTRASFVSAGNELSTRSKELEIWGNAGTAPAPLTSWYQSLELGMSDTLIFANGGPAYALTDRATYIRMQDTLPNLVMLLGNESIDQRREANLDNVYGVIQVNPERHPGVNAELAAAFVEWITSPDVQARIGDFGREEYSQPLFLPAAEQ